MAGDQFSAYERAWKEGGYSRDAELAEMAPRTLSCDCDTCKILRRSVEWLKERGYKW